MLKLYLGCVASGKTRKLLSKIDSLKYKSKRFITISNNKCSNDGIISSRFYKISYQCNYCVDILEDIGSVVEVANSFDCIMIDELQFFNNASEYIIKLISLGCNVYATCLNSNYKGEVYNTLYQLIPYATIVFCKGICNVCRGTATFSGKVISPSNDEYEKTNYLPLCIVHWKL